jgi:hypothetical protein
MPSDAFVGLHVPAAQIILAVCAHHQRPDNFNPNAFATVHPQLVEVYKRCVETHCVVGCAM